MLSWGEGIIIVWNVANRKVIQRILDLNRLASGSILSLRITPACFGCDKSSSSLLLSHLFSALDNIQMANHQAKMVGEIRDEETVELAIRN